MHDIVNRHSSKVDYELADSFCHIKILQFINKPNKYIIKIVLLLCVRNFADYLLKSLVLNFLKLFCWSKKNSVEIYLHLNILFSLL